MRRIDKIIWHCTATPEGRAVTVDDVRHWHVVERGWSDIGYHYLIDLDGGISEGRPLAIPGAHVRGHNTHSIGIAYVGGTDARGDAKDTRTDFQRAALYALTERLIGRFPGATVHGHNEFAAKACPSFDAAADWRTYRLGGALSTDAPSLPMRAGEGMADPVTERTRKPAVQLAGGAAAAVTAGASAVSAVAGAPWQALAVLGAVAVVLVIVFRAPIMERLDR